MGLETATYVSQLVSSNPLSGDSGGQGDDHLRLLKTVLQATFPNASRAWRFPATDTVATGTVNIDATTGQGKIHPANAVGGAITVNLPAGTVDGWQTTVIKTDSSANAVTITPAGSDTINGSSTFPLTQQYQAAVLTWCVDLSMWIVTSIANQPNTPDLAAIEALSGTTGALRKTAANTWSLDDGICGLGLIANGNGNVLTTGVLGDLTVPFACTITGVQLLADQTGSAVVDIWKDSYANYPPTIADKITASAPPTISSAVKATDTTLSGWTTSIAAGDTLRFNLNSVTSITRLECQLKVKRFI